MPRISELVDEGSRKGEAGSDKRKNQHPLPASRVPLPAPLFPLVQVGFAECFEVGQSGV